MQGPLYFPKHTAQDRGKRDGTGGREAYLEENHGRDLLGGEALLLAEILNLDFGVATIIENGEGPGLHILLDGGVIETATDKTPVMRKFFVSNCNLRQKEN